MAAREALSSTGTESRTETAWPTPTTAPSPGSTVAENVLVGAVVVAVSGTDRLLPPWSRRVATTE